MNKRQVPGNYFSTSGVGESDITVHAGSYHLALREAGIEMCNVVRYSSILPGTSVEVEQPPREFFVHGQVLECITAEATAERGERATAGIAYVWLYTDTGERHGGLVCEYSGPLPEEAAEGLLTEMLGELYQNGYAHFRVGGRQTLMRSVVPEKKYGTAVVALCFTGHRYEEAGQ